METHTVKAFMEDALRSETLVDAGLESQAWSHFARITEVHRLYVRWCVDRDYPPLGVKGFSQTVRSLGYAMVRSDGMRIGGIVTPRRETAVD